MKVKGVFFTAILTAVLCISSTVLAATYGGGSGTALDPYQILTPEHMNTIGANPADWASCFKLMADIDMAAYTGTQYNIIGNWTTKFTGTFDGDNHKIRNLTYSTTTSVGWTGLFGFIQSATIKNLGVENVNLHARGVCTGGLMGEQISSTITNCYITGAVTASSGTSYVGGLAGYQIGGTITNCYSTGSVTAVASTTPSGPNYEPASSYAGGLVGWQSSGAITNCNSTGSVISAASTTSTSSPAGAFAGGLVGQAAGSISTCYSTGLVIACAPNIYKGGLLGYGSPTVTACFWDNQTSGLTTSAGGSGVQGKTTALMKTLSTFTDAGWDFTDPDGAAADWIMPALGYPYLAWKGCDTYLAGDLNQDCVVNLVDFAQFASNWLGCTAAGCE